MSNNWKSMNYCMDCEYCVYSNTGSWMHLKCRLKPEHFIDMDIFRAPYETVVAWANSPYETSVGEGRDL